MQDGMQDTHHSDFPYTEARHFPTAGRIGACDPAPMTRPRSHIVPPDVPGTYHCIQRCVRQAFLCGVDKYTGRSFDHRKSWVEARIALVAECFAVSIHAYAVMSNHLHLVIGVDPGAVTAWTDEEIAARWVRLFPPSENAEAAVERKRERLLEQPIRLAIIRRRLGSLSWLMRCLVEPIARRANREDGCKGRFWEGRYKCQALCDERSLLAAMAYVDLNPIRAGTAEDLATSTHTSVARRIATARQDAATLNRPLAPIAGSVRRHCGLSTADYLQILDWTRRATAAGKRARIADTAPAILSVIDRDPQRWATRVTAFGSGWARAAGSAQDLMALAECLGQRWMKGLRLAAWLG
jgi:hypothetical protein